MEALDVETSIAEGEQALQALITFVRENAGKLAAHEAEKGIFKRLLPIGLAALKLYFAQRGPGDVGSAVTRADGMLLPREQKLRGRDYFSIFGKFKVARTCYRAPAEPGIFPLDAQVNLPERCYSYFLQEWMTVFEVEHPFKESAGFLAQLFDLEVAESVWMEVAKGFCRKFSFEAVCGMISLHDQRYNVRERDMAISFKGAHFPPEVILMGVRWYVAYPLSTRHVEELMEERGVEVDHSTINRWVIKYSPQLEEAFHRRKRPVWVSWRMDETYIKVKGQWYYLYRAVDKHGQTIDFLLTEHRDKEAALRFLKKAIRRHGVPETITIDGSDANEAAIKSYNQEYGTAITIRQVKYLNNIVEQDHRGVKRITRPMLGFKSFAAAQDTLVGIELMHMIKKRQLVVAEGDEGLTAAELFYSLAA